ncbi:MAG: hypothetical protein JO323_14100 [Acidobacteriia bacterium]|nr:hypothetical protein [Terriglobia bacterium]
MFRSCLVLAAFVVRLASGAAPDYSTDSILNGSNFTPAPFAPNSIISVFGTDLAYNTATIPAGTSLNFLPYELGDVRVYVYNISAPLLYVSPTQINLLVPSNLKPNSVPLRVVRQGVTGAEVMIPLVAAAPQLFATDSKTVIAQHADYSLITPDSPATPGETIIIYATGLGPTQPNPAPGQVPTQAWRISGALTMLLDGTPVSPDLIKYAGVTPGTAGTYQINLLLPGDLGSNPQIQAVIGDQISAPGIVLPTQPAVSNMRR